MTPSTTSAGKPATAGDPEEVDISVSEHFYEPTGATTARQRAQQTPKPNRPYPGLGGDPTQLDEEVLKAMMLGMPPPGHGQGAPPNPFAGFPGMEGMGQPGAGGDAEDPMMAMLQQMMGAGAAGGAGGAMPSFPGMSPMGMPGQPGATADPRAYLWRIVHALFAIGLGVYIALTVSFTGTKLTREESALLDTGYLKTYFWMGEALLLGRFLFKGGQTGGEGGLLGTVLPMIPQPYGGYLRWVVRYSGILRMVAADALLVVFVLGVVGWWNRG